MMTELDLVQVYMEGETALDGALPRARSVLEEAITAELAAALPSPNSGRRRWAVRLGAVSIATVAACTVLFLQLIGPGKANGPSRPPPSSPIWPMWPSRLPCWRPANGPPTR